MMKVVINVDFGGFSLSPEAALRLYELGAANIAHPAADYFGHHEDKRQLALEEWRKYRANEENQRHSLFMTTFSPDEKYVLDQHPSIPRHDPLLVRVVEEMGERANGAYATLKVVEIPDGVDYVIEDYDGCEHIAERHRTWS